jgi:hypothetical protein
MSGLPLQVGDLPPGIVAVRVIRGDFKENVTNQKVELRLGASGQSQEAVTGQDGRAQFAGLPVGQTVTAQAIVDGEPLASQPFVLPSEGGVRVMLVANAGVPGADLPIETSPSPDVFPTRAQPGSRAPGEESADVVPALFALVTGGVAMWWLWPAYRRARLAETPRPIPQTQQSRGQLLESLLQLERDHDAMRVGEESYLMRRRQLMVELTSPESDAMAR